jgi:hypothetical protein
MILARSNFVFRSTKIAFINFTSSAAFSEYVLDELSSVLVNNGILVVVDRASLDKVRQELDSNLSGEVSDESAQSIGQMLGAQALVTGRLTSTGDLHRVMFKVITTETAAVVVQHPADITNDRRIQALLAQSGDSQALAYGGQGGTGGGPAAQITQPPAPAAAGPKDGLYTFSPRPQAHPINWYLDKVRVSKGYVTLYVITAPKGDKNINWYTSPGWTGNVYNAETRLEDLDNPSKVYAPVGRDGGEAEDYEGRVVTFEKVTGTRFSIVNTNQTPPIVFDEFTLGELDQ